MQGQGLQAKALPGRIEKGLGCLLAGQIIRVRGHLQGRKSAAGRIRQVLGSFSRGKHRTGGLKGVDRILDGSLDDRPVQYGLYALELVCGTLQLSR